MNDTIQILIAMVIYMAAVIMIGVFYAKRANKSSEEYFLGGRSLGPWVTAMSAEASDMSGWLLMGLPGVAYWCGIADAGSVCLLCLCTGGSRLSDSAVCACCQPLRFFSGSNGTETDEYQSANERTAIVSRCTPISPLFKLENFCTRVSLIVSKSSCILFLSVITSSIIY